MSEQNTAVVAAKINGENDLKMILANQYMKQITNFFGDNNRAMRFLSAVMSATQRNPKLLECDPKSVINSFLTMAELQLMPSNVAGEAYVVPYKGIAQFQIGYQGLVTLFYRAGIKQIVAEIVRENDEFRYENGEVYHVQDVFSDDRGEAKGAYVIVTLSGGGKITKVMSKKEILHIAQKFSKSYKESYTAWKDDADPQLWMWKKTVLKQVAKLVPKSDYLIKAISEDTEGDSLLEEQKQEKVLTSIEEHEQKLRAVTDEKKLASVWAALPIEAKVELKAVKDEVKQKLTQPQEETSKQ